MVTFSNDTDESGETLLRLDFGHASVHEFRADSPHSRQRRYSQPVAAMAGSALRLCHEVSPFSDQLPRTSDPVLRRFRNSLHILTRIVHDPILWLTEDGTVLTDLRETIHLTESALRQFESATVDPERAISRCEAVYTLANLVEDRMDRLFDRMERLTSLRQALFRLTGIMEAIRNDQLPRVHDIEELTTTLVDIAVHDDRMVTLLDPESGDGAVRVAAHSINVAQVVIRLARSVATWQQELPLAVGAALLMDSGMMRLPADIIESHGLLNSAQRKLLQGHPESSAAIVRQMRGSDVRWEDAVRQHHERMDGSGYPERIAGAAVGPVARLLGVADVYVGLQSPRSYRPALSSTQALVETVRASAEGRLDAAWTCRLPEIEPHWLKVPTTPEPPSSAPACSALAA
jgi:HD-GYP domain-containing protein (c-di-GMP phosphodiesterase class II)